MEENRIRDVVFSQMMQMDLETLLTYCQIDRVANSICLDQSFWRQKTLLDFGPWTEWKPEGISFREQYIDLYNLDNLDSVIEMGRLDLLLFLLEQGESPSIAQANRAAELGHLHLLKELANEEILPTVIGANMAAASGHIQVLDWLYQFRILPNLIGEADAAENGKLNVLKWMVEHGFDLSGTMFTFAMEGGHLPILEWMVSLGYLPQSEDLANYAAAFGWVDILEWLIRTYNLHPDQRGINAGFDSESPEMIDWLTEHGYEYDIYAYEDFEDF